MIELEKIVDLAEEAEKMVDDAKAETKNGYLQQQLDLANSNFRGAVRMLKEAIRTKKELGKSRGSLDGTA